MQSESQEKADKARSAGQTKKALDLYLELCAKDPEEPRWPHKEGEIRRRRTWALRRLRIATIVVFVLVYTLSVAFSVPGAIEPIIVSPEASQM